MSSSCRAKSVCSSSLTVRRESSAIWATSFKPMPLFCAMLRSPLPCPGRAGAALLKGCCTFFRHGAAGAAAVTAATVGVCAAGAAAAVPLAICACAAAVFRCQNFCRNRAGEVVLPLVPGAAITRARHLFQDQFILQARRQAQLVRGPGGCADGLQCGLLSIARRKGIALRVHGRQPLHAQG